MTVTTLSLTIADARAMVAAAMAHGDALGASLVVAVVDAGGHLLAFERGDGARLSAIAIVQAKARAAAFYGRPTAVFEQAVQTTPPLGLLPDMLPFGGGLPVLADGRVIGAIAASGGSASEDIACAEAGLAAVGPIA